MTINRQVKSNLAKLLATENLTVEHSKVSTASFDIKNRVLSLPIWENVSDDVYDLLVGHEVGHAIYTPNEWGDSHGIPQSYLNIIEDARIERFMKVKYPGLSKCFYRGYSELNDQNFFEIKDCKLEELSLIDRINLFFKIGIHDVSTLIPFEPEESIFLNMTKETQTFDDVIDVCHKILKYVNDKRKNEQKLDITPVSNNNESNLSAGDSMQIESNSTPQQEIEDNSDQKKESEELNSSKINSTAGGDPNEIDENDEIDDSITDYAWEKNQRKFVSIKSKNYVYITPPQVDWNNHVVPLKKFASDMDNIIQNISNRQEKCDNQIIPIGQNLIASWKKDYSSFRQESNKSVSFLIKEFEMKKKANEYNRSSVSKTGVLDTNKLISYKWSDDLFKKNSVIPSGKNHGLIMYIDWSGSMNDNLEGTIKQLINLVIFCKKVQIPYQVYAFIENSNTCHSAFNPCTTHNEISVMSRFRLVEMFNNCLSTKELELQIIRVWNLVKCITNRYSINEHHEYELGSTPLNDTIFAGIYLFNKFKKTFNVDKLNTVFLTDGESNVLQINRQKTNPRTDEIYYGRSSITHYYDSIICFKDPKTGYVDHNISEFTGWQDSYYQVTSRLLEYYKWMTGSGVIGFRLSKSNNVSTIMSAVRKCGNVTDSTDTKSWKNDKFFVAKNLGYDELYVVQINDDYMGKVSEINADHTSTSNKLRNEFRKHVKSKMFNKIILSKFVDKIA